MATHTPALEQVWRLAAGEAQHAQHEYIEPEHLFLGLCKLYDVVVSGRFQTGSLAETERATLESESVHLNQVFGQATIDPTTLRRNLRQHIGTGTFHASTESQPGICPRRFPGTAGWCGPDIRRPYACCAA
jgi:ATP-dependent Clp protease ATP-binding subunit ClpA